MKFVMCPASCVIFGRNSTVILNHNNALIPIVPARKGGSCLIGIHKTLLIYRTCMRRAPAKPVRACIVRKLCPASHVTFEAPLRTSHFSLHTSHSTLHTSHPTLHTALFTPHTSHCTLHTPHFISSELF